MSLRKAIHILELHNNWRKGIESEMVNPIELGHAIEVILKHAKKTMYANV
jgi:hypothetical protein